jgi:hypothetical protein
MDIIDLHLNEITRFDHSRTPDEARDTAALVKLAARQISELEASIEFTRDSGWGARVQKQKQSLAAAVEIRLKKRTARGEQGEVAIRFASLDELNGLLEKLGLPPR